VQKFSVNLISFFLVVFLFLITTQIKSDELQEKKNIEDLIERYFTTWSNADLEGYESCFHPSAIVHFERNGEVRSENLSIFIEGQKNAHQYSTEKMKEVPLSKKIQLDKNGAQVIVRWKLTTNSREQYGYDYFTLIKFKKKWKIIYLIFNND
jgi:Putative lumazine-binding